MDGIKPDKNFQQKLVTGIRNWNPQPQKLVFLLPDFPNLT